MSLDGFAEIAGALQGESFTEESMRWAETLHAAELDFADGLHSRECCAEQRRSQELIDLENKLLARKLQVELDIGRRDATRDAVLLRASSAGNLLVAISVMLGCAFMFVYQIQLPAPVPDPPTHNSSAFNFSFVASDTSNNSDSAINTLLDSQFSAQKHRYEDQRQVALSYSGGDALIIVYSLLLWVAIDLLACALWIGLLLHLRLKEFKVHVPLFRYDCGHVHSVFGGYYKCRCLALEVALRRMFLGGTVSVVCSGCLSAWEISVVSFGSVSAGLLFIVPVAMALLFVFVGQFLFPEETAHPEFISASLQLQQRSKQDRSNNKGGGRGGKKRLGPRLEAIDGDATMHAATAHSPHSSVKMTKNLPPLKQQQEGLNTSMSPRARQRLIELAPSSAAATQDDGEEMAARQSALIEHGDADSDDDGDARSMSTISDD